MAESKRSSFTDRRTLLCRPDDGRLGMRWGDEGGFEQSEDGPVLLVIGPRTSDEKCRRLAARFGVAGDELIVFRDGSVRHG